MTKKQNGQERREKILLSIAGTILLAAVLGITIAIFPPLGIALAAFIFMALFLIKVTADKTKTSFLEAYLNLVGGALGAFFGFF